MYSFILKNVTYKINIDYYCVKKKKATFFKIPGLFLDLNIIDKKLSNDEKEDKVEERQDSQEGIVIVQMRHIQVVQNPTTVAIPLGDIRDGRQNNAAEEAPNALAGGEERSPQALHAPRRLIVEHLLLRDLQKRVGDPHQRELREQHEDGERHRLPLPHHAALLGHAEPPPLGGEGRERDEHVEDEAGPEPLQQRDAPGVSGAAAGEGDEAAVVEDDAGEHEDGDEHLEAGGWDDEAGPDAAVESGALLDEERE